MFCPNIGSVPTSINAAQPPTTGSRLLFPGYPMRSAHNLCGRPRINGDEFTARYCDGDRPYNRSPLIPIAARCDPFVTLANGSRTFALEYTTLPSTGLLEEPFH